jgi:hypothetical protein
MPYAGTYSMPGADKSSFMRTTKRINLRCISFAMRRQIDK